MDSPSQYRGEGTRKQRVFNPLNTVEAAVSNREMQAIPSNGNRDETQATTSNSSSGEIQISTSMDSGGERRATALGVPKLARLSSWSDLNKCEIHNKDEFISLLKRCKKQKFMKKVKQILEAKQENCKTMLNGRYVLFPDEKVAYEYGVIQYTRAKSIMEKIAQGNTEEECDLRDRFENDQLTGSQKRLLNAIWEVQNDLNVQGSQNRSLSSRDGAKVSSLLRSLTRMTLSQVFSADSCVRSDEVETLEVDVARLAENPGLVETQHRIFLAKKFEQLKEKYPNHSDEGIFRLAWEQTRNDTQKWMEQKDLNGHSLVPDSILGEAKNLLNQLHFRREENLKIRIKPQEESKSWRDYVGSPSVAVANTVVQLASFITGIQTLYQIKHGFGWIKDLPWNDQG
jgi:hypothetical protein